jgi:hypothetical protein
MITKDELKERFSTEKVPFGSDFSDMIDNCYNNSVSGNVVFDDFLDFKQYVKCENLILTSQNGYSYRISVDNDGNLVTTQI